MNKCGLQKQLIMIVRPLLFACLHKITNEFSIIKMPWPDMAVLAGNDRFCPLLAALAGNDRNGRLKGVCSLNI
jgi:hypothetical protein